MTNARTATCAALLVATALLAGCTARAATAPASISLAGRGVEITATPVPEAAFKACSNRIAADKAAKAAALAKAKAERAARAARAAAATATAKRGRAGGSTWRISCSHCGVIINVSGRSGTRGKCPRCGTPYVAYRIKLLRPPTPTIKVPFLVPGW